MENLKQALALLHEVSGMAAVNKATHVNCQNAMNSLGAFIAEVEGERAAVIEAAAKKAKAAAEKLAKKEAA